MKSGGYVYVLLAHNYRVPDTGASRARVLFNFGRKDQLDVEGLTRLVGSAIVNIKVIHWPSKTDPLALV